MSIKQLPRRNKLRIANPVESAESLLIPALLHQPTRTLRTQPDQQHQRHGGNKRRRQLEPPSQRTDIHENKIAAEPHQNAKGNVQLETRYDGASDRCGRHLGAVNRDRADLHPHPQAHEQPTDQQVRPAAREALGQHGEDDEEICREDRSASSEELVHWVRCPGAQEAEEGWGGVYYSYEPGPVGDAEFEWEGQVGAVGAGVVPASGFWC